MAKGDYVIVKSEIGGKLETDEIIVKQAGGNVEVEWSDSVKKGLIYVRLLGRTGKTKEGLTFATSAVRSIKELHRDAE